jgi:hypothetical protein
MITVFLRGGLGNQMFQYALGLNLARKNKTGLVLDTTFLNDRFPRKQFTYRTYDLDVFDINPHFTALSKISSAIPVPGAWLGLDFTLIAAKKALGLQRLVKEKGEGTFDPEVLRTGGNAVLWGFWQGEKYFADIADDIRTAFKFRHSLEDPRKVLTAGKGIGEIDVAGEDLARVLTEKIRSCNSVSLHVRRGDYLLPKYEKEYGATDAPYYDRAVRYVAERVPDIHVFVISDDPAWSAEKLKFSVPATYLDYASAGPKNSFHLELMSLCKHNIITNSSFSWWSAWLNRNPGKIVVAPERWHANGGKDDDIVPAAWIRM